MSDTVDTIKQQIAENPVLLYMKGDPRGPKCGFSAQTVQAVMACERPFAYVDVLEHLSNSLFHLRGSMGYIPPA